MGAVGCIDTGCLKQVRIRRMADVVEESGELDKFLILIGQETRMDFVEVIGQLAGEVVGTKRVSEPVVGGCGEDVLTGGKLLNGTEPLKFWRINDGRMRGRNQNVPVNLVPNDAVSTFHDELPSNRFFIALLGNEVNLWEDNA